MDLGLGLRGPDDISPELNDKHEIKSLKFIQGYRRANKRKSEKVMQDHRRSFSDTQLTFQVRKVMCGGL